MKIDQNKIILLKLIKIFWEIILKKKIVFELMYKKYFEKNTNKNQFDVFCKKWICIFIISLLSRKYKGLAILKWKEK